MIITEFFVKNDCSQNQYLQQAYQSMIKPFQKKFDFKKKITISDSYYQVDQFIPIIKESQQRKYQVDQLLYFIKQQLQHNKKMKSIKECIQSVVDLQDKNEEFIQIRNISGLCEYVKSNKYYLKKNNKIVRIFKFHHPFQATSIGQLQNTSAISLMSKLNENLNLIYYCLASGKASELQFTDQIQSQNKRVLFSKDEQYIFIGDYLRCIKTNQNILEIQPTYSQFSDCSRYFAYGDDFNVYIFDLLILDTAYILHIPNLFYHNQLNQLLRIYYIDFKKHVLILEDWKNQLLVNYKFQLKQD